MPLAITTDLTIDSNQPLQVQLYQQLAQRIIDQRFQPGSQMPSSRQLAADLGISRNTVLAVYDQLKAEGFLQTQSGRGVFVHSDITSVLRSPLGSKTPRRSISALKPKINTLNIDPIRTSDLDNNLPFTPGLPDIREFPIRHWNRVIHHQENRRPLMGYDGMQGYLPLRQAIAGYLRSSRGVHCHADQVIITNGAQQALSLVADIFLQPGDSVLIENPGYRGSRYALGRYGHKLVPVPLKDQVLDVHSLPMAGQAKLLYCTPTHQYPLGGILDLSQRLTLLNWAIENNTWIIEDDYDSEFHFYNKPIAAMQGLLDNSPVLYLGSFSKTMMPSVRIGYLVVPEFLVDDFVAMKRITSGESPLFIQAALTEFIESGQFVRHLRRMRQLYREKWEYFQSLVMTSLADVLTPVAESAGMHLVLEGQFDDLALCHWLREKGFGSAPLSAHFIDGHSEGSHSPRSGLVLGFASANQTQMRNCVELIREWFDAMP
ncbi:GntR family transcriptional regulator [Hahella sp. CCB-MM4]|uniref:MocR-like pyridoxine biosynthesis transcription factor PdxR n=1 Tax=Hahella sp. (strain CCB-MM4) TaxID=1926491 RepID=UPI000B9A59E7|nr:PLP-dependent aminotransferase family protein [Hahella sp. CCB-MM4]OZG74716.1 GntR family transcriptional regulator [Hahella sp. CCB-MM4]